jgi:ribosomal protein L11 methyltransferase
MPWLQLHLTVDKSRAPLIESLFEDLGAVAVTLGDAGDEPMLEPGPGETPLWQANRVSGLFAGDSDAEDLGSSINQALSDDVSRSLRVERIDDEDWERAWLDRFRPMRFGKRLWIRPGGQPIGQKDAVIVELDPGLAFGTGTHPTTALCLQWLDGHDVNGRTLIDFGCGSGVLGIAALKLGAARVVAVDHDPQAVLACRDNAARNGVQRQIEVVHSEQFDAAPADLVLANILANVLIELAPRITALLRPDGQLLMSGILGEQTDSVEKAYTERLEFVEILQQQNWVLMHGRIRQ